jgi:hypothetical protein
MKTYPYQDLSMESRAGENWKDIPGLEGYYQVSDHGRIKRLAWQAVNKRGFTYSKAAMIITQTAVASYNAHLKTTTRYLRVALGVNKKTHNFSVPRLVYHCFVAPFDMKDRDLFIFPKDNDTLNTEAENLFLGDQVDKQQRMTAGARRGTPFLDMTREKRAQVMEKIMETRSQNNRYQISRYSLSGKLMETYLNAEVAATAMKTDAGTLSKATRGIFLTLKGYLWRRGAEPEIDLTFLEGRKRIGRSPIAKQLKTLSSYDLQGNITGSYSTLKEAARVLQVPYGNLSDAIRQVHLTAAGLLWRYGTRKRINVKKLTEEKGFRYSPLSANERKVSQYDLDGRWIKTFATIAEAARATKTDSKGIDWATKGRAISAGGYLWQSGTALRLNPATFKKLPNFKNSALDNHQKKKRQKNREKIPETLST